MLTMPVAPLIIGPLGALVALQDTGATTTCNDQARHETTLAGTTSTGTQQCASFSFTITVGVGSVTFTTPSQCDTGRREQSKDCFACGPASEGNHCTARGFETTTKVYSIGGGSPCPSIPSTLPTTLEEAQAVVQCKDLPLKTTENTWCASVKTCAGKKVSEHAHGDVVERNGFDVLVWLADPSSILPGPVPNPTAEAIAAMRALPLSAMPPALANAWLGCAPIGGAELNAEVVRLFVDGGPDGEDVTNVHRVRGTVLSGGRFSVGHLMPASREGDDSVVAEDLVYDGASFFWGSYGLPFYQVYGSSSPELPAAFGLQCGFLSGVTDLVDDPLSVLRLQGSAFERDVDPEDESIVIVRESYPGVHTTIGKGETTYRIDTSVTPPWILRTEIRDDDGELVESRDYSNYEEVADSLWRPMLVVQRCYVAGDEDPYFEQSLRVNSLRVLSDAEEGVPLVRPEVAEDWWFVHL